MARLRNRARAAWVVALGLGTAAGCYRPNIQDGGLLCADGGAGADGGVCPEGFHCARNGTCREGSPMVCTATSPRVKELCQAAPGTDCDPICQSRCDCGRCNIVGGALMCMPPGNKQRGELCNIASDDCVPGNICMNFCGGTRGARCYRFCSKGSTTDHSLCGGNYCDITMNPGGDPEWTLCEPPLEACNPVGDNGDCADPVALGCYVGPTGSPVCDCRGTAQEDQSCGPYNSCAPGLTCVRFQVGDAFCLRTCRLNGADCTPPQVCAMLPGNDTFGFCRF